MFPALGISTDPAPAPTGDQPTSEATMAAALAPFGWTCGPDFWQRYYSDPWVFNLANAVERLVHRAQQLDTAHDVIEAVRQWGPDAQMPRRVARALAAYDAAPGREVAP
jgi:hypothetical protein